MIDLDKRTGTLRYILTYYVHDFESAWLICWELVWWRFYRNNYVTILNKKSLFGDTPYKNSTPFRVTAIHPNPIWNQIMDKKLILFVMVSWLLLLLLLLQNYTPWNQQFALENRPSRNEISSWNHQTFSGAFAVSFREGTTKHLFIQWLFLFPLKGGRWHIIPQLAVYTTYIPLILPSGGLYATYHLLEEPFQQPLIYFPQSILFSNL